MLNAIMAILVIALLVVGKARRRYRRYLKGQLDVTKLLGTLAAETVISVAVVDTVVEKTWLSSIKARYDMQNWTNGAQVGPITFGLAHSDYTNAEIEEWIENTGSWDQGDLVQQEVARRKIRMIGSFESPALATETALFNDGRPVTTKCGWSLVTGESVKFWLYNEGSGALATTDPVCHVNGHANLWPQ